MFDKTPLLNLCQDVRLYVRGDANAEKHALRRKKRDLLRRVRTGRGCSAPLATLSSGVLLSRFFRFRPWILLFWPTRALVRHEVAGFQ